MLGSKRKKPRQICRGFLFYSTRKAVSVSQSLRLAFRCYPSRKCLWGTHVSAPLILYHHRRGRPMCLPYIRNGRSRIRNGCSRIRNECSRIRNGCSRIRNECSRIRNGCSRIRIGCFILRADTWVRPYDGGGYHSLRGDWFLMVWVIYKQGTPMGFRPARMNRSDGHNLKGYSPTKHSLAETANYFKVI